MKTPFYESDFWETWHVVVSRQDLSTLVLWAAEHLRGKWTFGITNLDHIFYIEDDGDAVLFKLTWGGNS